jgi:hypothetical protein
MCGALTTTVSIARQVPVRRTTSEHASVVSHVANAVITLTKDLVNVLLHPKLIGGFAAAKRNWAVVFVENQNLLTMSVQFGRRLRLDHRAGCVSYHIAALCI